MKLVGSGILGLKKVSESRERVASGELKGLLKRLEFSRKQTPAYYMIIVWLYPWGTLQKTIVCVCCVCISVYTHVYVY